MDLTGNFEFRENLYSHVDGAGLTCGTNALVSVDLQDHVGEPHRRLTGRVAHTGQVLTARRRRRGGHTKSGALTS